MLVAVSQLIGSVAFKPRPPTRDFGVAVLRSSADSVILSGNDQRAILHPGVTGLWWAAGYARLGDIVRSLPDGSVERELLAVTGVIPTCEVDFDECLETDLDHFSYRDSPADRGFEYDPVEYMSPLGPMDSWLVRSTPGVSSQSWAILIHGTGADRREGLRALPAFLQVGLDVLLISYRNDPEAPVDPSGRYQYGQSEWQDLEAAVAYALNRGAARVVLLGFSTGGAIATEFLESSPLADKVAGVVFDSPNLDLAAVINWRAARYQVLGLAVPRWLIDAGISLAGYRYGIDWRSLDYIDSRAYRDIPILLFHGRQDDVVPVALAEELAQRSDIDIRFVENPQAGHGMSWNIDPDGYESEIRAFLAEVLEDG